MRHLECPRTLRRHLAPCEVPREPVLHDFGRHRVEGLAEVFRYVEACFDPILRNAEPTPRSTAKLSAPCGNRPSTPVLEPLLARDLREIRDLVAGDVAAQARVAEDDLARGLRESV